MTPPPPPPPPPTRPDSVPAAGGRRDGRLVASIVSVALHLSAAALLVAQGSGPANAVRVPAVDARLVSPAGKLAVAPQTDGLFRVDAAKVGRAPLAAGCGGQTYTGIGAAVNAAGFVVDLAADGPAERAGLVAGDAILNVDSLPPNTFEPGHVVALRVLREGVELAMAVDVGPICNEVKPVAT